MLESGQPLIIAAFLLELTFYTETHFLEMMRNVDENFYQNFQVEKKRLTLVNCFQVTLYINIMGLQRDIVGVLN